MGAEAQEAIPVIFEALRFEALKDKENGNVFVALCEALEAIGHDLTEINITYTDDGTTENVKEYVTSQREKQRKDLETKKMDGGSILVWRRTLSTSTPPQKDDL